MKNNMMMRTFSLALFTLMYMEISAQGTHDWEKPLNFQCSSTNSAISEVDSKFHGKKKDRRFKFDCRPVQTVTGPVSCNLSGYVNNFDQQVLFACPNGGYLNGITSVHSNRTEDRIFKFRCCTPNSGYRHKNCRWIGWLNYWSRDFLYFVPRDYIIRGINSVHDNRREDRRFQFEICQIAKN